MSISPTSLVQTGTVNGTPVMVDIGSNGVTGGHALTVITLTQPYTLTRNGQPYRTLGGGQMDTTGTVLAAGRTVTLLAPEASALIAAGFATLVGAA